MEEIVLTQHTQHRLIHQREGERYHSRSIKSLIKERKKLWTTLYNNPTWRGSRGRTERMQRES